MTHSLYIKIHSVTGLRYLGQTERDPLSYKGSGIDWKEHLRQFGNTHTTEVLFQSESKQLVDNEGRRLSKLWNIVNAVDDFGNKIWANRIPETGGGFSPKGRNKGTTPVTDKHGNKFRVPVTDSRYINGDLIPVTKGQVTIVNNSGERSRISVTEYQNGNYQTQSSGKVTVVDTNGITAMVSVTDPRYLSGEVVAFSKGRKVVIDVATGKKTKVRVDDPRLLSGEFIPAFTGLSVYKDKQGNRYRIPTDDPRVLSGELVHVTKGMKHKRHNQENK